MHVHGHGEVDVPDLRDRFEEPHVLPVLFRHREGIVERDAVLRLFLEDRAERAHDPPRALRRPDPVPLPLGGGIHLDQSLPRVPPSIHRLEPTRLLHDLSPDDPEFLPELGDRGLQRLRLLPLLPRTRCEKVREGDRLVFQRCLRDDLDEASFMELLHRRVDPRARHSRYRGDLRRGRGPEVEESEVHARLVLRHPELTELPDPIRVDRRRVLPRGSNRAPR